MAKVLKDFYEKYHDNHLYKKGHTYPAKGYEADKERVSFLSKKHPTLKAVFLEEEKATKSKKKSEK